MLTLENKVRKSIDQALGNSGGKIRGTRSVNPHVSTGVASRNSSTINGHTLISFIYTVRRPAGIIEVTKGVDTQVGAEVQPAAWEPYKIATEVKCLLSAIEKLESIIEANFTRTDRQRQATLQCAFNGKLL